jgi:hypothetical protein
MATLVISIETQPIPHTHSADNEKKLGLAFNIYKQALGEFIKALKHLPDGEKRDGIRLQMKHMMQRAETIKAYLNDHPEEVGSGRIDTLLTPGGKHHVHENTTHNRKKMSSKLRL